MNTLILASAFGPEWSELSKAQQILIDEDYASALEREQLTVSAYRQDIGPGNLRYYAIALTCMELHRKNKLLAHDHSRSASLTLREAIRQGSTWPQGYPLYLILRDGAALCAKCAGKNYKHIARANRDNHYNPWKTEGLAINWENRALACGHCDRPIQCAYPEK